MEGSGASSREDQTLLRTLRGIESLRISREVTLPPEEAERGTPQRPPQASLPLLRGLSPVGLPGKALLSSKLS